MSVKTLLIIFFCSISIVYGQNSNAVVNARAAAANAANAAANALMIAANKAAEYANRTANTNDKKSKPLPTPTPIPANTTIHGKVFYEDDGKPVRRSAVVLFNFQSGREPQTLTDENGNFEIKNVQVGSYFPMVLSAGVVNFFPAIDFEKISKEKGEKETFKEAMQGFQEIVADGKTNLEVKIPVKRGGSISGGVTYSDGSPATGRPIQLLRRLNGKLQPVISNYACVAIASMGSGLCNETDDRGLYHFGGLPAGEYFIRVNEPVSHGRQFSRFLGGPDSALALIFGVGTFLNTYYPNTIEVRQAKPIKVELGKEQKDINVTIPDWKLYKMSGKVVSAKDEKAVRSKIYIVQKNELLAYVSPPNLEQYRSSTETDEEGNWTFSGIPKGNYTLQIEPYNSDSFRYGGNYAVNAAANVVNSVANTSKRNIPKSSPTPNLPAGYAKTFFNLNVENSNLENVEIKVYQAAWILGTVIVPSKINADSRLKIIALDENGNNLESVYVYFYDLNEDLTKNSIKIFEIKGLPKGKVKLKIESSSGVNVKSATVNGIDLLKDFIELKAGQSLANVRIVLENNNSQEDR